MGGIRRKRCGRGSGEEERGCSECKLMRIQGNHKYTHSRVNTHKHSKNMVLNGELLHFFCYNFIAIMSNTFA